MRHITNNPYNSAVLVWNPSISSPSNWKKPPHFLQIFPMSPTILGWLPHFLMLGCLYYEKGLPHPVHTLSSGKTNYNSEEIGFPSRQPFCKMTVITARCPMTISSPSALVLLFLPQRAL